MSVDSDRENELQYLHSIDISLRNIERGMYLIFVLLVFMLFFIGYIAIQFWPPRPMY